MSDEIPDVFFFVCECTESDMDSVCTHVLETMGSLSATLRTTFSSQTATDVSLLVNIKVSDFQLTHTDSFLNCLVST